MQDLVHRVELEETLDVRQRLADPARRAQCVGQAVEPRHGLLPVVLAPVQHPLMEFPRIDAAVDAGEEGPAILRQRGGYVVGLVRMLEQSLGITDDIGIVVEAHAFRRRVDETAIVGTQLAIELEQVLAQIAARGGRRQVGPERCRQFRARKLVAMFEQQADQEQPRPGAVEGRQWTSVNGDGHATQQVKMQTRQGVPPIGTTISITFLERDNSLSHKR